MSKNNLRPLIPFPALLIEENFEKILVVSDIHIGWETSLVEKGIHIPSQISRIQLKLLQIIRDHKPDRLIFLGDIKQAIPRISFDEWRNVPEFFKTIQKEVSDVSVVLGNHDGNLEPLTPHSVHIFPSGGVVVGKDAQVGLFHGHAWPSPEVLRCEVLVMGHIHPIILFKDKIGLWVIRQVWVKSLCDAHRLAKAYLKHRKIKAVGKHLEILEKKFKIEPKERKLIVMPSFNDLVGGSSINRSDKRLLGPILSSGSLIMNDAELYLLDGTFIGTVEQVRANIGC